VKVFKVVMEKGIKKVENIVIEVEAQNIVEAEAKAQKRLWEFRDGEEMSYCDKHAKESLEYAWITSVKEKKELDIGQLKKSLSILAGKRFKDAEELEKCVSEIINFPVKLTEEESSGLVADYAFIAAVNEWISLEIYYLVPPYGENRIFITEVNVEKY